MNYYKSRNIIHPVKCVPPPVDVNLDKGISLNVDWCVCVWGGGGGGDQS